MSAWQEYHRELVELHAAAGSPSSRQVANRAPLAMSHSTVNDLLHGKRLPSLTVLENLLIGLGANEQQQGMFRVLWQNARGELGGVPVTTAPGSPVPPPRLADVQRQMLDELRTIRELLEGRHEMQCPNCNATIRARMADS